MEQSSTYDMIMLGLEYMLFAIFLISLTNFISLRDNFAETRSEQTASINAIRQYREFNQYDKGECTGVDCKSHLYGDEVIELIRKYFNEPDFEIYIDKVDINGSEFVINATLATANPSAYTLDSLQKLIDSRTEYHPYLVYDGITPSQYTTYSESSLGEVTGIALFWKKDN